jgi:glutathione S-transferase
MLAPMAHRLYVVPASHPCAAVEAALAMKGIEYKRIDRLPVASRLQGRATYGGSTVPGLVLDGGEKIVGSRAIMRRLETMAAEPPLYPTDPAARAAVEEAERWGDEVLQGRVRRIVWATLRRNPKSMESYTAASRLPVPIPLARPGFGLVARAASRLNRVDDPTVRADLAALPGDLDRVDAWIADGVLGGERPNAADLQIGASLALAMSLGDVRPLIADRPAARLAAYVPPVPGATPTGVLPADWLAPVSSKNR